MKKAFKLSELDCGHCAQEIEEAVAKLEGVNKVRVNFLSERMTLDADDARFDEILGEIRKIIKTIEPGATFEG
ncbi:heavy metal-associated domain protein [Selenomonas sp. oral taxon 137 str. F0430]|uniref:heavy-metal-associated domain-containing protein n=1 Tax=unclassified Selenomonas TaxID=2637378 RepID=UPI0001EB1F7D|nr:MULTISPECIES: heavy-metal-associated domain-containing protein [unclassified Selenomonas]EFR39804.1 heavy metal-associated domain protein [Selenomonas sp. oral taxon 137 str. F0430]EJP29951.1 heavy metal-associated domain protein [Selenomonas sp. FOBRC9]